MKGTFVSSFSFILIGGIHWAMIYHRCIKKSAWHMIIVILYSYDIFIFREVFNSILSV